MATYGNVIISNNHVDIGTDITAGITTTYKYDCILNLSADATVIGNTFHGIRSTTGPIDPVYMVLLTGCSTQISHNNFARTLSSITNYINDNTGTTNHIITENIFDQSTTDGITEDLGVGFSEGTIFERNINQISYVYYSLLNHDSLKGNTSSVYSDFRRLDAGNDDFNGSNGVFRVGMSTLVPSNNFLSMLEFDLNDNTNPHFYAKYVDLDTVLPSNVKVLSATVNMSSNNGLMPPLAFTGETGISLIKTNKTNIMDVINTTNDTGLTESSGFVVINNAITDNVLFPITVTPSINNYITSSSYQVRLYFYMYAYMTSFVINPPHILKIRMSPIKIKFVWI